MIFVDLKFGLLLLGRLLATSTGFPLFLSFIFFNTALKGRFQDTEKLCLSSSVLVLSHIMTSFQDSYDS